MATNPAANNPKNIVDWNTITNFVIDSFVGYGIPREDAEICADVLLESDKRGIAQAFISFHIFITQINY